MFSKRFFYVVSWLALLLVLLIRGMFVGSVHPIPVSIHVQFIGLIAALGLLVFFLRPHKK